MDKFPSKETVQRLRERYPEGTRIELVSMEDSYSKLTPGEKGTVEFVDDTGTIFCKWDNGSGLGLVYGEDRYKKLEAAIGQDAPVYTDGAKFWRDLLKANASPDAAFAAGGKHIDVMMRRECTADDIRVCRELFAAMYEDAVQSVDPAKLIYPYDFQTANDRTEASLYHNSRKMNSECAETMHKLINESCYKTNYYNLELAAMRTFHGFGFKRVNMVLAKVISSADYDGRYSDLNKKWAKAHDSSYPAFDNVYMNTHPILIDGFADHARKLYKDLDAERFALPGRSESGTNINGYEIVRAIQFDNDRGFAIGLNPHAVNQFVTWQFTTENGARDFYWGNYCDELSDAAQNYTARIISYMDDYDVKEVRREAVVVSNRTAGITPDMNEVKQTLNTPEKKPSTLKQIRDARSAPKPPRKEKKPSRSHGDIDI